MPNISLEFTWTLHHEPDYNSNPCTPAAENPKNTRADNKPTLFMIKNGKTYLNSALLGSPIVKNS